MSSHSGRQPYDSSLVATCYSPLAVTYHSSLATSPSTVWTHSSFASEEMYKRILFFFLKYGYQNYISDKAGYILTDYIAANIFVITDQRRIHKMVQS